MNIRKLTLLALFIALSVIGAMIKIPAVVSSVALDVFPALIAVVLIDKKSGAIVAGLGHLISAFIGGLPLGPFHVMIAIEMMVIVWVFGYLYKKTGKIIATLVFIILNGIVSPLPFIFIMSMEFYLASVPSLLIASSMNVIFALLFIPLIRPIFQARLGKII